MIRYENTVPGLFVRRVNRFVAEVLIDGNTEQVHVRNTGRLQELLLPKAKVTLQKASDPKRKTAGIQTGSGTCREGRCAGCLLWMPCRG